MAITLEIRKLQADEGFKKNAERVLGTPVPTDFVGTQFTCRGGLWTVLGLNRRVRKLPVVAVDSKDRVRWFTVEEVNAGKQTKA